MDLYDTYASNILRNLKHQRCVASVHGRPIVAEEERLLLPHSLIFFSDFSFHYKFFLRKSQVVQKVNGMQLKLDMLDFPPSNISHPRVMLLKKKLQKEGTTKEFYTFNKKNSLGLFLTFKAEMTI